MEKVVAYKLIIVNLSAPTKGELEINTALAEGFSFLRYNAGSTAPNNFLAIESLGQTIVEMVKFEKNKEIKVTNDRKSLFEPLVEVPVAAIAGVLNTAEIAAAFNLIEEIPLDDVVFLKRIISKNIITLIQGMRRLKNGSSEMEALFHEYAKLIKHNLKDINAPPF